MWNSGDVPAEKSNYLIGYQELSFWVRSLTRRTLPTQRSATLFCHELRNAGRSALRCEKLGERLWPAEKLSVEEISWRLLL